jgi:superfamily I DNA and/or RNA helicase
VETNKAQAARTALAGVHIESTPDGFLLKEIEVVILSCLRSPLVLRARKDVDGEP